MSEDSTHVDTTQFLQSTVGLVDYDPNTGNLLVRGNMPLTTAASPPQESYFAYDELGQAIGNLLSSRSPSPINDFDLSNYYLIDVSLLDNQGDLVDVNNEFWTFSLNPSEVYTFQPGITWPQAWPPYSTITNWNPMTIFGKQVLASPTESPSTGLVWWPVQAYEGSQCEESVVSTQFDFVGLIDYLNDLLTSSLPLANFSPPSPASAIIYFHCNSGVNRTGAVNVAYFLKYGSYFFPVPPPGPGMSLADAFKNAESIGPDASPGPGDDSLVLAYCNYIFSSPPSTTANLPQCVYPPSDSARESE